MAPATSIEHQGVRYSLGGLKCKRIVRVRRYPKYQVVSFIVDDSEQGGTGELPMTGAFTPEGHYIGTPREAKRLIEHYGIKPELRPGRTVCTIGYSSRRRKWFGWSHRAIAGFGLGSVVRPDHVICTTQVDAPIPEDTMKQARETVMTGTDPEAVAAAKALLAQARRKRGFKPGYKPATMADCKRMAALFASEVS